MRSNNNLSLLGNSSNYDANGKIIIVKKRQSNKRGNYILGETIGEGAFAKVKIAKHIFTEEKVAIKILDKQKMSSTDDNNDIMRIKKEISIIKSLRHKNIIQLYEIMESQTTLYIVMEYCEGKELFDYIIKRKRLTEREACRFFQQIINGVEYLHLMNITHRDLKPENLLLDSKKRIKISDFGLSTISSEQNFLLQTPCGTPSYAPPEMLRGDEYNGEMSDIWSCGIILYTMLCGNLPCVESKEELIYQNMVSHNYDFPSYISPSAIDLIDNMLKLDPNERYTFQQIKEHPWFYTVKPQLKPGIVINVQRIPIDENILNKVENYGYNKEECRKSLIENRYDSLTAFYYLVLKQIIKEGKTSISDLYSDTFVDYVKNINNWEKPEKIKDPKFKDYLNEKRIISFHYNGNNTNSNYNIQLKEYNAENTEYINKNSILSSNVKRKIISFRKNRINNNNQLPFSNDPLPNEMIEKITKELNDKEKIFNNHFDLIDKIDSLNSNEENLITQISNILINTTIFGQFLKGSKRNQNNHKIPIKCELVDKFYTLQKYKNLVESVKAKRIGIFPKKIYDWNYSAFNQFLNDEEDQVFTDNFIKSSHYSEFINKLKRGIQSDKINSNQRAYSKNVQFRRNNEPQTAKKHKSNLSEYSYNSNDSYNSNTKGTRPNKFITTQSYKKEYSNEKTLFSKNILLHKIINKKYNNSFDNKEKSTSMSHEYNSKKKKVTPFIFNISTSTMNEISEDEEIFPNINTIKNQKETYESYFGLRKKGEGNLKSLITEMDDMKDIKQDKSKSKSKNKDKDKDKDKSPLFSQELASLSLNERYVSNLAPKENELSENNNNNNITSKKSKTFEGPIDIKMITICDSNKVLQILQNFFKKNDYFIKIKKKKLKCSKVNLHFEIEIVKICGGENGKELNYLKLKTRNGKDNYQIYRIMNQVIDKLPDN